MKQSSWVYSRINLVRYALVLVLLTLGAAAGASLEHAPSELMHGALQIQTEGGLQRPLQVQLPFRWDQHFPGESGRAIFTGALPPRVSQTETELLALYMPRLGNQYELRLNGALIGNRGEIDNAWYDASKVPTHVVFSSHMLRTDAPNVLQIKASFQSLRSGGISTIYFGSASAIASMANWDCWWQQTSYIVILIALMLMGSIAWFIWLRQREGVYGLFALSSFWGAVSAFEHLMGTAFLPWPLLGIVSAIALAWHVIFMTRFTLGIVGREESWVRLSSLTIMMAIGIAHVLAEPIYWTMAFGFLCMPLVVAVYHSAKAARAQRTLEAMALFTVSSLVASAALRDLFVVYLPESGLDDFALLPHALFLFVVMMAWILVRRYTEQHQLYHDLNITLEQRVDEREQQLKTSYTQLKSQGEERAKLLERQRIMQDIHDGVGGQLVGLVSMAKRGTQTGAVLDVKQLQEHAQLALDELRIAVDAMQPVEGDLAAVLATLRYRLEPRLKASGLTLVWDVEELPTLPDLTPRKVLQIQKILLEGLTNVMLHAKAKVVTLSARADAASIAIGMADDGLGFDEANLNVTGHGLANMRFRAEAIGADLTFTRGLPQGTLLKLQIPV